MGSILGMFHDRMAIRFHYLVAAVAGCVIVPSLVVGQEGNQSGNQVKSSVARPLMEVIVEAPGPLPAMTSPDQDPRTAPDTDTTTVDGQAASRPSLQLVTHEQIDLIPPRPPNDLVVHPAGQTLRQATPVPHRPIDYAPIQHDATCDGCNHCDSLGFETLGCDSMGCDSMGCDGAWCNGTGCDGNGCGSPSLGLNRDRWFGGIEYLMMWRRGDRLPPLVTTGALNLATTDVLLGDDRIMDRMGSGARITIGTWLDNCDCLGLVGRGWYGGRTDFRYSQDQTQSPTIVRPFLNVSDNQVPAQDVQIIAQNGRATGAVFVSADSEAFGADLAIRQYLHGGLGATIDMLYGYQFMRLNESLGIASTSTSLDEDFAPVGSIFSLADQFNVSNEFHGGQIGLAANYRERCWSFNGLAKVGFGSLRRQADRSGITVTTVDDETAVNNNGLLVRSTNAGTVTDHTFGWIPELDLSLGWQRYAGWDLTFGYHLIVMTDALQASGAIDPDLAVNTSDPPTGAQRPTSSLQYRTFYLQGIHFGIQHVY